MIRRTMFAKKIVSLHQINRVMTPKELPSGLAYDYSRAISLLKCGLIVFVVFIHTYLDTGNSSTFYAEAHGWIRNILFLSNSMFFLLSGYLFFLKFRTFSWSWYGRKLRRRISSLLIPYLLWNTILLLLLSVGVLFVPSLRGDYFIPLQEMTPSGLFRTYFCLYRDNPSCPPLDGPFWFLRDLMGLCLVSPIFYLLSRLRRWSLLLVFLAYFLPFPSMSIIYFYVGAYMAIYRVDLRPFCKGHFLLTLSLFVILMFILHYVSMPDFFIGVLHALMSFVGMIALAHIAYRAVSRWVAIPAMSIQSSLFMVFAFHILIARVLTKVTVNILQSYDLGSWAYFLMHGINALLCLVLCYGIYRMLCHISPKLCRILGARAMLIAMLIIPTAVKGQEKIEIDTTHLAELPVIELTFDASELTSWAFTPGHFVFHSADTIKEYSCSVRRRGSTALVYSKPNYAIKFYDKDGNPKDVKFLGMRKDNNWILDGMASDCSRMRNRVSMDLWLAYSHAPYHQLAEPKAVNGYRGHFVEVYVNGVYMGIFCLNERVDRKQLKIKKFEPNADDSTQFHHRGLMYKAIDGNSTRTPFFLWQQKEPKNNYSHYDGMESVYPDIVAGEPFDWFRLRSTIYYLQTRTNATLTNHLGEQMDVPVFNDFMLLLDLLYATDNVGKNYYCWYYDLPTVDKRLGITPWDLDTSWGRDYRGDPVSPSKPMPSKSDYFNRLSQYYYGYADTLSNRYAELRQGPWHQDSLIGRFDQYFDLFERTGAWARDSARWEGYYIKRKPLNVEREYIRSWIIDRLYTLDTTYHYDPSLGIRPLRSDLSSSYQTYDLWGCPVKDHGKSRSNLYINNRRKCIRVN